MSSMVGEVESLVAALHSSLLNTDRELQELGVEEEVLEGWLKTQQGSVMCNCCIHVMGRGATTVMICHE